VVAFCEHRRKSIELVDLNASQLLAEFELPDCLGAKGVFPPSRNQILVAVKGHIHSWDLQTRQSTVTALEKWAGEDIVLDSQALLAAGGNKSGTVTVWDVNTGKLLNSSTEHTAEITALAFNNDAKLLASADENGAIVVWSVQPLQPKTKALKHHEGVQSLAFTPDGLQLAAGGPTHIGGVANFDKSVFRLSMWNVNTGALYNSNFEVRSPIWYLRFTDGGRQLIAGGMTEIRLFDVSQDVAFQSTEQNAATNVTQPKLIAISDRVIASIHHDLLTVKSQLDQQPVIEYRIPAGVAPLSLTALDGTVAVGGKDGSLLVTEPTHGTLKLIGRHPSEAGVLAFSPDKQLLAAAGNQGSVSVWSVERAESVWSQKVAGAIRAVAFAADGTVAAGGWASDSSIGFLFLLGRNRSKEVPQVQGVSTLAFSADGTTLAVGHGTSILLLDTNTLNRFEGLYHGEQIGSQRYAIMAESLAFSPDDKLLLSAAADGRVRVFDVLERKRLGIGFVIPGVPDKFDFLKEDRQLDLSHLTVRQDGAVAVVANGAVVYWQLGRLAEARETACAIANRNFTPEEWQEFFPGTPFSVTCLGLPVWTPGAAGSGSPSPSFEAVFE
jgi:WD40 repeat protein